MIHATIAVAVAGTIQLRMNDATDGRGGAATTRTHASIQPFGRGIAAQGLSHRGAKLAQVVQPPRAGFTVLDVLLDHHVGLDGGFIVHVDVEEGGDTRAVGHDRSLICLTLRLDVVASWRDESRSG